MNKNLLIIVVFLLAFSVSSVLLNSIPNTEHETKIMFEMIDTMKDQQQMLDGILDIVERQQKAIHFLQDQNQTFMQFFEQYQIDLVELTGYAPLDPRAVEGMCYSGDPNITASGERLEIGSTIAASRDIPFGTKIYIAGYGWREVHDRGGMITEGKIDIAVATREEAFEIGRKQVVTVSEKR